jgi:hypothetical protein
LSNPILKKSYIAGAAGITPNSLVKFSASGTVILSAAATDDSIGATDQFCNPLVGDRLDVTHEGIANLQAGGTIARGNKLGCDASGHVIVWAAGEVIGRALESAVIGDVIPVLLLLV